jgi:hypothetical protein
VRRGLPEPAGDPIPALAGIESFDFFFEPVSRVGT